MVPMHRARQACTLAALGRGAEAQAQADMVLEEMRSGSERYFWPECHRLLGDYLRLCPGTPAAQIESAYAAALDLARSQGARCWELGAAVSLARFWSDAGDRARALDLLVPVCRGFGEPLDLPLHREATELVRTLRA
jgi:hypothetical protein